MKRIIDMLLKMVWPAIISFILLIVENLKIFTVNKYDDGNSVTETSVLLGEEVSNLLIGLTVVAVVIFSAMFVAGFIWNIVYTIKHKDE